MVEEAAEEIAGCDPSLHLLSSFLRLSKEERRDLVSTLLQANRFDVGVCEKRLDEMVSAAAECSMSRELSSADKQRIYEEARAPVRALVTELDEAKLQLDQVWRPDHRVK